MKFFGIQNGGECFCDKKWSRKPNKPMNALNCKGWGCTVEGQFCPKGTPGASSSNFCCENKKWIKTTKSSCNVSLYTMYKKVDDKECNVHGNGLGGVMRNAIYSFGIEQYEHPADMKCKTGGNWQRPYGDVTNNQKGFEDCAKKCTKGGFKYFGTECPMGKKVHCQCSNNLRGSKKLPIEKCNARGGLIKADASTHCVGPYTAGPYVLGAHGTGSVYMTKHVLERKATYETTGKRKTGVADIVPGSSIALKNVATGRYCGVHNNKILCNQIKAGKSAQFLVFNQKGEKNKLDAKQPDVIGLMASNNKYCADEPTSWKSCAKENQSCKCSGEVVFSKMGGSPSQPSKTRKVFTGSIGCNTAKFGTLLGSAPKQCFCRTGSAVTCNRSNLASWEKFKMVRLGKYVGITGGRLGNKMRCSVGNTKVLACDKGELEAPTKGQMFEVECVKNCNPKWAKRL